MTEQDHFYYCRGYNDGQKAGQKAGREGLAQFVCDSLREEFYGYNDCDTDYYAGFDDGLKRAMRVMKGLLGELDGRG